MSGWDGEVIDEFRQKLRALRKMSQDIVELRRGDHSAVRLKIEQAKVDELTEWSEAELLEHFERWAGNPEVRDWVGAPSMDPAERERRLRIIFGLTEAGASGEESASVQPGRT
jgi:esterase/lipase superfamily enzyme